MAGVVESDAWDARGLDVGAKKEWIVVPGSSWLKLDFGGGTLSFIVGNAVIKSMLPILNGR